MLYPKSERLISYDYRLPEGLIANRPARPRDAARIFAYDTKTDEISFDRFYNLDKYLPKNSLLVLNDTRVVPARAILRKETGGKIEVLFLVNEWRGFGPIPVLVDRKVALGAKLFFDCKRFLEVIRQEESIFYLKPNFPACAKASAGKPAREIFTILQKQGITPLPKYIKNSGLSEAELRKKYQSVFAKKSSSVAAPTASLHFTERLFQKLEEEGVRRAFITLSVGLGTFAPVSEENLATGTLHTEFLSIPEHTIDLIRKYKHEQNPVVAVGTTAVRTLESEASKILSSTSHGAIQDATQMFIRPPYDFRIVDALITNFHLPNTSLMMLVQAFLTHKNAKRSLVDLYALAIKEKFRFYSFGDAMVIKG